MRNQLIATLLLAGCLPEAPAEPTYAADVEPILAAQCVRCHGAEQIGGAPPYFRLDTYAEASRMATFIATRAGVMGEMPPGGPELNQYQRDVLINWAKQRMPGERGGNRPPVVTLDAELVDGELQIGYEIDDPDGDRATGTIELGTLSLSDKVHAGQGRFGFDARSWKSGTYELILTARDDFGGETVQMVDLTVQNEDVAPFATASLSGDIFRPGEPASVSMTALACQKLATGACGETGSETLTVDLYAVRGNEKHALASGVIFTDGQTARIPFDVTDLVPAINWRLEIEVRTPTQSRTVVSAPFIVSNIEAAPVLAEVKPLFEKYCTPCHGTDSEDSPTADIRFISPCEGDDECYRGNFLVQLPADYMYRRIQVYQNMPPRSAIELVGVPQPTQAERKQMSDWILAGGPL